MTVRYTATALAEIEEICSYVAKDNERAAASVAAAIERAVAAIALRPRSAPVVYEGRIRAKLVGRYQYRIFYEVIGPDVIVRNVRSTKRLRPWESPDQ
jgi:plasmid stabilization system protein ParE